MYRVVIGTSSACIDSLASLHMDRPRSGAVDDGRSGNIRDTLNRACGLITQLIT